MESVKNDDISTWGLGGGYDFEGYDVYFLATTNIIVARNSVKYALHMQNHTPRGHKGTKNRCLWTGPNNTMMILCSSSETLNCLTLTIRL
jgi:hypothetical protein